MRKLRSAIVLPLLAGAMLTCSSPRADEGTGARDEGSPADSVQPAAEAPASQDASSLEPAAGAGGECPNSDTRPTVFIRECDTGVINAVVGGCTLADQLHRCESETAEFFSRCIAKTTEAWIESGLIKGSDKGAIQICAAEDREKEGEAPKP